MDIGPLAWNAGQAIAFEARVGVVPSGTPDWQTPSRTASNETAIEVANTMDGGSTLAVSDNGDKYGGNFAGSTNPGGTLTESTREFGAPFPRHTINGVFVKSLGNSATGVDLNATVPEGW